MRASLSCSLPRVMASPGAATWMPTRILPSGRALTDSASSISVVVMSSTE
ncbi:Uncharacterised protein [Bordetella pertussis]|nr:Uncharacterised protein [Bordetella pertussis]CFW38700.1 Uncharacterised protein [Bordetella pertussis]